MPSNPQKRNNAQDQELRRECGLWLRRLREGLGLSQSDLAKILEVKNYTFISQLELGTRRLPTERYEQIALALGVHPPKFTKTALKFNDPDLYAALFSPDS